MSDVIRGIHTKLVHRHPHVFGEMQLDDPDAVIKNWERIKEQERQQNQQEYKGLLDGIPLALPALSVADKYQKRAARVGFDWPDIQGVLDKLLEEIGEFQQANDKVEQAEEFGDMLFAFVNLARWLEVDPETALRETNAKFRRRFTAIEAEARKQGRQLSDMTLEEMDKIWEAAKGE
jgi:tetrapyrrole methylase family protein/MazG family protein